MRHHLRLPSILVSLPTIFHLISFQWIIRFYFSQDQSCASSKHLIALCVLLFNTSEHFPFLIFVNSKNQEFVCSKPASKDSEN